LPQAFFEPFDVMTMPHVSRRGMTGLADATAACQRAANHPQ
jgi:hypothetical protein